MTRSRVEVASESVVVDESETSWAGRVTLHCSKVDEVDEAGRKMTLH